jgi:hypothetical protein
MRGSNLYHPRRVPFREAIMRSLVVGVVAVLCVGLAGCKKKMNNDSSESSGPYSGGGNPTGYGAAQAVRGAVKRTVTLNELKNLQQFIHDYYTSNGQMPTGAQTWQMLSTSRADPLLNSAIQEQLIYLVPNPAADGLWAYTAEVKTTGGHVVTNSGIDRVTPQDFASRFPGF